MLHAKMAQALNDQMNREFYSSYLYLAMAAAATSLGLKGAANWFTVQQQEERIHFDKFYAYLLQQGARVALGAVPAPPAAFSSMTDMFEQTLTHERLVTRHIHALADLARKTSDHATEVFLQWFVTEQVEEEANDQEVLARLRLVGKDGNGLLMVDAELATRVFVPPAAQPPA